MSNLKDYATGTVSTAPSPADSGTTLDLQSGEGARMPAVPFNGTLSPDGVLPTLDNAEKVVVTDVTGDTLTIARAQGDTSAQMVDVGWRFSNVIFSADFTDFTGKDIHVDNVYVGEVFADNYYMQLTDSEMYVGASDPNGGNQGSRVLILAGNGSDDGSIQPGNIDIQVGSNGAQNNVGQVTMQEATTGSGVVFNFYQALSSGLHTIYLPTQDINLNDFANISSQYVPYSGAVADIDLGRSYALTNFSEIKNVNNGVTIHTQNPLDTLDTPGYDLSLSAGDAYGDGNAGRVAILAGSGDYSTGGKTGDGGNILIQMGGPGGAGGAAGVIQIYRTNFMPHAEIDIESLTDLRTYHLPDQSGTLAVRDQGYLVADLPAGTVGDRAYCTDLDSPSYGSPAVGGGSTTLPVFYDGTQWVTA